jgi:hypothetical protein
LHFQRRRGLDFLAALTVTEENAGTLLALARDFEVREFWYGGDRTTIPSFWELRNLLGDARKVVKNLSLTPFTREIGGAVVRTRQLPGNFPGRTAGPVLLEIDCQGKSLLIIPPAPAVWRRHCLAAGLTHHDIVIVSSSDLRRDFLEPCLAQVQPEHVIVAGSPPAGLDSRQAPSDHLSWHFTRAGAVTLRITAGQVHVENWQP